MPRDPIVEEVRATREKFAVDHGCDLAAILAAIRAIESEADHALVSLPPKRTERRAVAAADRSR